MSRIAYIVFFALLVTPCISDAETIDVHIKGVDDGLKTTKQQDYKESVLFAKREAIERAGVKIKSMTTVKDLVVNSDYIESKAEAVLLPGYNILDMGYSADGTYQVVLVGKVKTVSEGIDSKELRYAKSLMDRGEKAKAKRIITDIIENSKDDNAVTEAMYCQVVWKFAADEEETFEKLKAYFPNSKYTRRLVDLDNKAKAAERRRVLARRNKRESKFLSQGVKKRDISRVKSIIDRRIVLYKDGARAALANIDLEWVPGPSREFRWLAAKYWAQSIDIDGGSWRLPTLTEIGSIYMATEYPYTIQSPLSANGMYWTSVRSSAEGVRIVFVRDLGIHESSAHPENRGGRAFAVRVRR